MVVHKANVEYPCLLVLSCLPSLLHKNMDLLWAYEANNGVIPIFWWGVSAYDYNLSFSNAS